MKYNKSSMPQLKVIALIPARYDSQRFPGKLMKDLAGQTVILRTYQAAINSGLFDEVYVVTDSQLIYDEIINNGGQAFMSTKKHATGTDRIAEFAKDIEADVIVNIQGDEPFIHQKSLRDLIRVFEEDIGNKIDLSSLMIRLKNQADFLNPNNVKVVVDKDNFALYFSRAPIPYSRDKVFETAYKHIGVYAFRKPVLEQIARMPQTELEQIEKLENLRFLQNGLRIKMIETDRLNFGIDTEEDLQKAELYLKKQTK